MLRILRPCFVKLFGTCFNNVHVFLYLKDLQISAVFSLKAFYEDTEAENCLFFLTNPVRTYVN